MPSPAFRAVAKHLSKFHGAIAEVLSPSDVVMLLGWVHAAFTQSLRAHLTRLAVAKDGGPQHGSVTLQASPCCTTLSSVKASVPPRCLERIFDRRVYRPSRPRIENSLVMANVRCRKSASVVPLDVAIPPIHHFRRNWHRPAKDEVQGS